MEKENNVLVVKRVTVTYHLKAAAEHQETVERVLGFHADYCPVARTIGDCVDITTRLEFEAITE